MAGLVVREFQEDLARLKKQYAGRQEEEWRALYLLALEREQLVTSHYAGAPLHERIASLDAPPELRRLVHHALFWAARDEDMHTVYARGVLIRRKERLLAIRAVMQQLGGLLAGWSSAVSQHVTFRKAPIARSLSWFIAHLGLLAGKVPTSARKTLSHQTLCGFAGFNVEAEETAAMCWEHVATLGDPNPELCLRVAADERNHAAVFQALIETFDEEDAVRPGETAERLAEKLRAIDNVFVPRDLRADDRNRLGTGADVFVHEDKTAAPAALQRRLLSEKGRGDGALLDRILGGRAPPFVSRSKPSS